ncbi:MAG: hypothetical protein HUJ26_02975 [Planctomycetaceae bacterium]|nr:hypothetical protein [Planctomycetaceae bacterium]
MRLFGLLITAIVLVSPNLASSAEMPSDEQLRQWVKHLNHAQRSVREEAEAKLRNSNRDVIVRLEELRTEFSPEERRPLTRILQDLKYRELIKEPQKLTLDLPTTPVSLKKAIDLIAAQSFQSLQLATDLPLPKETHQFSKAQSPFWEAVIELLDRFQLDLTLDDSGQSFVLTPQSQHREYIISDQAPLDTGEASSIAYRINGVRRKTITGQTESDLLRISFQVLFPPHRAPLILKVPGQQTLRIPDEGELPEREETLLPFSPEAVTEHPCNFDLISPEFHIDWLIPKSLHPHQLFLTLKTQTLEAVGRQEFVFSNWSVPNESQRQGLAVVTRDQIERSEDQLSILMLILHSRRGAPFESHREWISHTRIRLSRDNQDLIPTGPPEKVLEADGTTALRFEFPDPEDLSDWTLRYELPTDFQTMNHVLSHRLELEEWLPDSSQQ